MKRLIIATRQSPMALWQANAVAKKLQDDHPQLTIELLELTTAGDRNTQQPLNAIGGKSLFVKELQQALLDGRADIAVHCIKDMSANPTPGLSLSTVLKRDDPRDVVVSTHQLTLDKLPKNAIVGTSSPRRCALLKTHRPDLTTKMLRGNVNTRLNKLEQGQYDAIILAAAGLVRLEKQALISEYLDTRNFTPAIGQGALGIECRADDTDTQHIIAALHDSTTALCIQAERRINQILQGDCFSPIGAYAYCENNTLTLNAMVASQTGQTIIRASAHGPAAEALAISETVTAELLKQGAANLLQS